MSKRPERKYDSIFARILGNLMALDGAAPNSEVLITAKFINDLRANVDQLIDQPVEWDDLENMTDTLRACGRRFRNFDSGAYREALDCAAKLEANLRFRIHHAVCQVAAIAPEPSSGFKNLTSARGVLIEASTRLRRLNPTKAENLAAIIKKYDAALEALRRASTAATVVRKNPAAKKAALS